MASRMPHQMEESGSWKHCVHPFQRLATINDAWAFVDEDAGGNLLGQLLDQQTCRKMRAPPQPARSTLDAGLRLFAEIDLGNHAHQTMVHVKGCERALLPPFSHRLSAEKMNLR